MRMSGLQEAEDAVDGNGVSQSVSGGTPTPLAESSQGASGHSARELGASSVVPLTRITQEGSWAVGLQSPAHPSDIMEEVLKALHELEISWKKIGPYSVRCRWVPPLPLLSQNRSQTSSASTSLSKSPMTLGSLPTCDIGLQANDILAGDGEPSEEFLVRFQVQLYKTRDGKYLLDVQRVGGPNFLFLDLCTAFLREVEAV